MRTDRLLENFQLQRDSEISDMLSRIHNHRLTTQADGPDIHDDIDVPMSDLVGTPPRELHVSIQTQCQLKEPSGPPSPAMNPIPMQHQTIQFQPIYDAQVKIERTQRKSLDNKKQAPPKVTNISHQQNFKRNLLLK